MNRVGKVLCTVAGVVVGLPLTLYVGHGVVATLDLHAARGQAVTDLDEGLPAAREGSEQVQGVLRDDLQGVGAPSYSWQEVECELDSIDAGWMVQDYEQSCDVRTVDVYPAPSWVRASSTGGPCSYVPVPVEARRSATEGQTGQALAAVPSGNLVPSEALTPTDRAQAPCSYVVPPVEPDRVRLLAGARPRDVPAGEQWLVVQTRVNAARTTVGCSPWGLVFCSEPSGFPVMSER